MSRNPKDVDIGAYVLGATDNVPPPKKEGSKTQQGENESRDHYAKTVEQRNPVQFPRPNRVFFRAKPTPARCGSHPHVCDPIRLLIFIAWVFCEWLLISHGYHSYRKFFIPARQTLMKTLLSKPVHLAALYH